LRVWGRQGNPVVAKKSRPLLANYPILDISYCNRTALSSPKIRSWIVQRDKTRIQYVALFRHDRYLSAPASELIAGMQSDPAEMPGVPGASLFAYACRGHWLASDSLAAPPGNKRVLPKFSEWFTTRRLRHTSVRDDHDVCTPNSERHTCVFGTSSRHWFDTWAEMA
jgi:hypothetical protein